VAESIDPRAPKQARSAWTRQRLLDVLGEMLAEQPLHEIGVSELAARADVTIGALYGRFGGKIEMAVAGYERYADDAISRMQSWVDDPRRAEESAHQIVWAWVSGAAAFGRRRSPMSKLARTLDDERVAQAEHRIVECATSSLLQLLAPRIPEERRDEAEHRLAFGVITTHALMARRDLVPKTGVHGFTNDELHAHLTELILSSVGLSSESIDNETSR
jgi:AcrR family transcriptional regulator